MANEGRLIDANVLKRHMTKAFEMCGINFITKNDVLYCIEHSDTVDAVEVVRCKDCVWWDKEVEWCNREWGRVKENHFCAYGERKDND